MARIILATDDPYRGYHARVDAEPRSLFPGFDYWLTITAPAPSELERTCYLGKSGVSLRTFLHLSTRPVYIGIANITSLDFDREGLTVRFLAGPHRAGEARALQEKTKYISRNSFPKIEI